MKRPKIVIASTPAIRLREAQWQMRTLLTHLLNKPDKIVWKKDGEAWAAELEDMELYLHRQLREKAGPLDTPHELRLMFHAKNARHSYLRHPDPHQILVDDPRLHFLWNDLQAEQKKKEEEQERERHRLSLERDRIIQEILDWLDSLEAGGLGQPPTE